MRTGREGRNWFQAKRPGGVGSIRSHYWAGLLAILLLALQPLIVSSHCSPVAAHSHLEGQSTHHTHEDTTHPLDHHNSHHDEHSREHDDVHRAGNENDAHSTQVVSAIPDHYHELCCSHNNTPFVRTALAVRSGVEDGRSLSLPQTAVVILPFKLCVLAGIHSRAGPSDTPRSSIHLAYSLLGRAPPVSA